MDLLLRLAPLHIGNIKFRVLPLTLKYKHVYTTLNILENNLMSVYYFFITLHIIVGYCYHTLILL